jgi:hypothetical protein
MVKIVKSEGIGQTKKGAYFNALRNSGIKNYETKVDIMSSDELEFAKYFYDYGEKIKVIIAHDENKFMAQASISWITDGNEKILIGSHGIHSITNGAFVLRDMDINNNEEIDNCTQLSVNVNDKNKKYICAMVVAIKVGE